MRIHRSRGALAARFPGIVRCLGAIGAIAITGVTALATTTGPATASTTQDIDFAATVALSNCSGSLVAMPDSQPQDPALVLTNGHCLELGMPSPGEVIMDVPSSRSFALLDSDANTVATLYAESIAYSTMTDTDITLYRLDTDYRTISDNHGIEPLMMSASRPQQGTAITVVSAFWEQTYSCGIAGFAPELHEAGWVWQDSVRYTPQCHTIGGTSGSPVVDDNGTVVAVNNTLNENGQQCTMNNPCEVDEDGTVTVHEGVGYAQQTYLVPACVDAGNVIDLDLPGCRLPRP